MGYHPFMPSYPHIEEYRAKLQDIDRSQYSDLMEEIKLKVEESILINLMERKTT